jgi:hypothetical protein
VKFAQCVKIWPFVCKIGLSFDICVKIWLFLKSCVQFLMDTILNLAIAQFLMKKNRDALLVLCVSHLNKQRRELWRCIFPLLHMQKKNTYRLFSTRFSLHQHATRPLAHIRGCMCANGHSTFLAQEALHGAQVV